MSPALVYLILKLDVLSGLFIFLSVMAAICVTATLIICITHAADNRGEWVDFINYLKQCKIKLQIIIATILTLCAIAIPTTKDAALIYIIPKITQNKQVAQIPDKLVGIIDSYLKIEKE